MSDKPYEVVTERSDLRSRIWRRSISWAIQFYRWSPLCPKWGPFFARVLACASPSSPGSLVKCRVGDFDMLLDLSCAIDSQLYYSGSFEPDTIRLIQRVVKRGDLVIDVGANNGYVTLHMAQQVGPEGRVFSFEPSKSAHAKCQLNVSLNNLSQVIVVNMALGSEIGAQKAINLEAEYKLDGSEAKQQQVVAMTRLDDFLAGEGISKVSFLKIDTDGMETHVLKGAATLLQRHHPTILFEVAPEHLARVGSSAEQLISEIRQYGYDLYDDHSFELLFDLERELATISRDSSINLVASCIPLS